jgi:2-polyprenyl-3-methyl-5-hydroxy-6-metoxy-1,4-benzoquinol methylase
MSVLDAGAGEGKNAAAFVRLEAHVDAIECSSAAIENGRKLHPELKINWLHSDISAIELGRERYDVVVCYGLIHCLASKDVAAKVLSGLMRALKTGGTFILASFNDGSHDMSAHPGFQPLLLPHGWFVERFRDWQVEVLTDTVLFETHPHNNIPHHHSLTRLMAVKL